MDLYADLPLAKGAKASSALDADGKPKTSLSSTSSVWASTPLMVPQAAKNKANNRLPAVTTSNTSMLPAALAAGRGKSPVRSSVSLAFKPASVVRRTAATQVFQKQQETEPKKVRPVGGGLGYVAATEVKVTHVQQQKLQEKEADVEVEAAGGHFFQAMYRDEYQPARPNSYEAYCKEREDRRKMEQVKKELGRRQREQERESKLEREQLAKDLAEGRAPAMKLPAPAGRGRGMTMPAWMRKKIEENAAVAASQPEDERDVGREHENTSLKGQANFTEGQFEDAEEPRGLGFSTRGIGHTSSPGAVSLSRCLNGDHQDARDKTPSAPMLDEFGREVRQEPKRKHEDQRYDDRKLVSSSLDKRDNGRHETSESRPSTEKRRRTSGWDRRSPPTTSLTSRVVLLQNMVGPGEVDDELQDEVKGECSETYGPVTKCTIYEVTGRVSAEEAVRIFVQFKNAGDATKALTGLNGRFFGGRKVKAVYYDESKFDQTDLTCQ